VHLGMTSQDLNDHGDGGAARRVCAHHRRRRAAVRDAAADLAIRHRRTLMAGRTMVVVAEPITFGFQVAGWVADLDRAQERLARAADESAVGRVSGAVGTHATIDPKSSSTSAKSLVFVRTSSRTQVSRATGTRTSCQRSALVAARWADRDRDTASPAERGRRGIRAFRKEQKGSSAMPHSATRTHERVCGLARVVRGTWLRA